MPIITIQMRGEVVQNVEGIPPAITIRIVSEAGVKEFTAAPSTLPLPTRNTKLLREIISTAEELRLAVTTPECAQALDYIASKRLAGVSLDQVEEAINNLFPDRFIEP